VLQVGTGSQRADALVGPVPITQIQDLETSQGHTSMIVRHPSSPKVVMRTCRWVKLGRCGERHSSAALGAREPQSDENRDAPNVRSSGLFGPPCLHLQMVRLLLPGQLEACVLD
jgi:hypothetical protein